MSETLTASCAPFGQKPAAWRSGALLGVVAAWTALEATANATVAPTLCRTWRRLNCRHAPRRVGRTARFPSSTPGAFIAHPGAYSVSPFTTHLVASVSRPWMRTSHCALWSRTNPAQISRLSRARTRTARKLRRRRLISEDNLEGGTRARQIGRQTTPPKKPRQQRSS
jgi:hypothetical protein